MTRQPALVRAAAPVAATGAATVVVAAAAVAVVAAAVGPVMPAARLRSQRPQLGGLMGSPLAVAQGRLRPRR